MTLNIAFNTAIWEYNLSDRLVYHDHHMQKMHHD